MDGRNFRVLTLKLRGHVIDARALVSANVVSISLPFKLTFIRAVSPLLSSLRFRADREILFFLDLWRLDSFTGRSGALAIVRAGALLAQGEDS